MGYILRFSVNLVVASTCKDWTCRVVLLLLLRRGLPVFPS
jgi:hypothetical protein